MQLRSEWRLRRAHRAALRHMPVDGDVEAMITAVSQSRGRTIDIVPFQRINDQPSGVWMPSRDHDWVFVDAASGPRRRAATLCHEAAHMLLGHSNESIPEDLEQYLQALLVMYGSATPKRALMPTLDSKLLARAGVLMRHGYASRDEHDAETLATRLMTETARRGRLARLNVDQHSERLR